MSKQAGRRRSNPVEARVERGSCQRLQQNLDKLLSKFAFNFNLRHYKLVDKLTSMMEVGSGGAGYTCRP